MPPQVRTLIADRGDAGMRLDRVLARHLADLGSATRTKIQRWIVDGLVTVNGGPVRRVAARAAFGDFVEVAIPAASAPRVMHADNGPLDVVYEDDHLLAVNKPPGIVVHPTFKHPAGTLMNTLLGRAREWPRGQRPSIVGRLDKLTSGIVVVARSPEYHAALQRALHADATAAKTYIAVVYGRVTAASGRIDLRLALDRRERRRVVASAHEGARCATEFVRVSRVSAPRAGLSVLRCSLVTGRRHQIRAHLQACGWPIVGDPVYGERRWKDVDDARLAAVLRAFPRQALHASHVSFVHPVTRARVTIAAPLPDDLASLVREAGLTV